MRFQFPKRQQMIPLLSGMFLLVSLSVISADEKEKMEFFETRVRPVLFQNCFECHGEKKQEGGLRADSLKSLLKGGDSGPAIVPGQPEKSELILAVNYDADGFQMPPKGKLNQEDIDILTRWVKEGAYWPDHTGGKPETGEEAGFNLEERARHWSFQPVKEQPVPKFENQSWPINEVDHFILSRLEKVDLVPAKPANKRTLLRRITFDLTGLPPSPEEMEQFLSDDSPDAYEKVVDRLLASPHYGERWARHWLDLVRYAETMGHEFDYLIYHAPNYRDYVIRAFNNDLPYDQFVIEHIAGDLLDPPRRNPENGFNESVVATGFYWLGQGKHSPVDIKAEEADLIDNQIDVLGKAFLGLTISCTRCHDHKFDPITTKDYYALSGFLQSSRRNVTPVDPPEKRKQIIDKLTQLKEEKASLVKNEVIDSLQKELEQFDRILLDSSGNKNWKTIVEANSSSPNDFFYVWNQLNNLSNPEQFLTEKNKLISRFTHPDHSQYNQKSLFNSLDPPFQDNWFVTGDAFRQNPNSHPEMIYSPPEPNSLPVEALTDSSVAHSGLISGKLQGTIRSKTFTITEPKIFYKVMRSGGVKSPGRQYKNGQVSLIIDGFEIIKNPIYGKLVLNLPGNGKFQWYEQDVSKWIGHKAYIEILDEDDGFVAVDSILFGKTKPEETVSEDLLELIANPEIKDPVSLASGYKKVLLENLKKWKSEPELLSKEQVESINLILNALNSSSVNFDFSRSWNHVSQYRSIEAELPSYRKVLAITEGTPENEYVFIRGNHKKKGDEVPRRFLEVFGSEEVKASGSGRLELAHQIASAENPLFARVIVNRIWLHHFGKGIVQTPDDFGKMGKPPTHPELLDFLASELIRNGWSIKNMHRMLVLSRTYQMTSDISDLSAEVKDPENLLLHRMPIRRLEAEAIRDSVLMTSGQLNRKMYGKGIDPYLTPFMEGRGRPSESGPLDGDGRRSIYIMVRRNFLTPLFLAFDYPTPFTTAGRRSVSNVPAQGLIMMNNPFVIEQAGHWAKRILDSKPSSTEEGIRLAYIQAFGRLPNDEEIQEGNDFLGPFDAPEKEKLQRWTDYCHVLFNVKEFVFVK